MRELYIIIFVAVMTSPLAAQQSEVPDWLQLKFGEQADQFEEQKIAYYLFLDEEGAKVADVAPKDISMYEDALMVDPISAEIPVLTEELLLSGNFHAELYHFDRKQNEAHYYRIANSSYILKIESYQYIASKFQQEQ